MIRIALGILVALLTLPLQAQEWRFAGTDDPLTNPMRGWWLFIGDAFESATVQDYADVADLDVTVVYGLLRLDDFRDRDLPDAALASFDAALGRARDAGVKVILRFAYNYPGSSTEYEDAVDAPLDQVLRHIAQLAPLVTANADVIAAWQGGFIGAWGEGHTSSNGLDSPQSKAVIRDAIVAAAPPGMALQWRYPPDVLGWGADGTRWGIHNDCFLASPNDVGTYSDDPAIAATQRASVMALSDRTYFSGETCDAQADQVRTGCADILREGAQFHLSALNLTYFRRFHDAWRAEGCFDQIANQMGYRFQIDGAVQDGADWQISLTNTGWARLADDRALVLTAYAEGVTPVSVRLDPPLSAAGGGQSVVLSGNGPVLATVDRVCLSAPDPAPGLENDLRFAIRFANADTAAAAWDPALAAWCWAP